MILDKTRKEKVDDIISGFIITDENGNVSYSKRIISLLNKASYAIKNDWDDETILLEAVASLYESMLVISNEFDVDDISVESDKFMGQVYNRSKLNMKSKLIDQTKKKPTGFYKSHKLELSDLTLAANNYYDSGKDVSNHYNEWFNDNKENILTKKQLAFLDDINTVDSKNRSKIRRRINNAAIKEYDKQFKTQDVSVAAIKYKLAIIEELLEANNFIETLDKYKDKDFIIDIISEVSIENRKLINKNIYNKNAIKEMKVLLYKEYNHLTNDELSLD